MTDKKAQLAKDLPSEEKIAEVLQINSVRVAWLAGDGSDRRYYRIYSVPDNNTFVLMKLSGDDAKKLKNRQYDWIELTETLQAAGIRSPKPLQVLYEYDAIIIEDYGDTMLETLVLKEQSLPTPSVKHAYDQCFSMIASFLDIAPSAKAVWCQRSFDADRYVWELDFFRNKYLIDVLDISLSKDEEKIFTKEISELAKYLAGFSHKFVHRDFHSRNVMMLGQEAAVIDFQDARLGSSAYDLVSLCFDSYVSFDARTRLDFFKRGVEVIAAKHPTSVEQEIEESWPSVLLQRQLKAIGSFGYLTVEKQRGDYLKYVAPATKILREALPKETYDRWPFLTQKVMGFLPEG